LINYILDKSGHQKSKQVFKDQDNSIFKILKD